MKDTPRPLPEALFVRALCHERKRAERSGRPFILMLLDPGRLSRHPHGADIVDRVVSATMSAIRDTDVPGWHSANAVLGVIFTELGASGVQAALAALEARVTSALQDALSREAIAQIQVSFHCFPDAGAPPGAGPRGLGALYPDLAPRDETATVARLTKRAIDIAASAAALVVLSPLLLVIAVSIKLTSPGPILFRQQRIGQYGVPFTFLKFRSMHVDCDPQIHRAFVTRLIEGGTAAVPSAGNGEAVYKITEDPRVTALGRFLRRTSLDELPQLLHVLRGEMSLVGPRPPIAYEIDAYQPWHRRRLLEVPGITGLWQVSGRSRLRFDDMVRLDLRYARSRSLWLDLKILLRTPRAVLSGDGAY